MTERIPPGLHEPVKVEGCAPDCTDPECLHDRVKECSRCGEEWPCPDSLSAGPAEVNAMRALEEAAKALGWSVSASSGDLELVAPDDQRVYIDEYGGRRFLCTSDDVDIPVELVPLLLEAAR